MSDEGIESSAWRQEVAERAEAKRKAELTDLRARAAELGLAAETAERRNAELCSKHGVERIRWEARVEELEAENKQLRQLCDMWTGHTELVQLRAENERLVAEARYRESAHLLEDPRDTQDGHRNDELVDLRAVYDSATALTNCVYPNGVPMEAEYPSPEWKALASTLEAAKRWQQGNGPSVEVEEG